MYIFYDISVEFIKWSCFTISLYNFLQQGCFAFCRLSVFCQATKQTHTLLNHTTKGNKLLMCPIQAEACVFSGEYCQRWLVMSETAPRHGSSATLLCTTCQSSRLFPSSKVMKRPSPWWQKAGLGGAPRHDCAEPKNSPTIYRCSHGPFSWHLALLTLVFLQLCHSLWHSREMSQGQFPPKPQSSTNIDYISGTPAIPKQWSLYVQRPKTSF